jgi:Protein of unknown function (DUF1616)
MKRYSGILGAAALAIIAAAVEVYAPNPPVVVGLALVFVLPGYALLRAIAPGSTLDPAIEALLTLTLSITSAILGGLILNFTRWGLERESWTVLLAAVTVGSCLVAAARRFRDRRTAVVSRSFRLRVSAAVLAVVALAISGESLAIARTPFHNQAVVGYTLLALAPSHDGSRVRVRVTSDEQVTTVYRLKLNTHGSVARVWTRIRLTPGQSWHTVISRHGSLAQQPLTFALYRARAPHVVYRTVSLTRVDAASLSAQDK